MVVLVVEDQDYMGAYIQMVLKLHAIEARTALSAEAAWEQIARQRPQLILTDLNLPGESGLEFVRQLKADPELAGIPVVAVTADDRRWTSAELRSAGCVDFLVKPILPDALVALVARYLPEAA